MSLHIIVNGMTSDQRTIMQKFSAAAKREDGDGGDGPRYEGSRPKWTAASSMNNLRDVHQLYCGKDHPPLEKEKRNVFVVGDLAEVRGDFQSLMRYCARDVAATGQVLRALYPLFRQRCPHPATLGGMLEMSSCYLPVSERWHHYVRQSDDAAAELEEETARALGNQAKEACAMLRGGAYRDDLWLWNLDWSTRGLAFKKSADAPSRVAYSPGAGEGRLGELKAKFAGLLAKSEHLMKNQPRCPGYPKWYMELCEKPWTPEWDDCLRNLTPSKRVTPMLLRMTWMGMPLHYHDLHKWGYICLEEQLPAKSGDQQPYEDSFSAEECDFPAKAFESLVEADMKANKDAAGMRMTHIHTGHIKLLQRLGQYETEQMRLNEFLLKFR